MKKLERSIGLVSIIAISLSAMLGSGIFVLPGLAITKTGSSVWLAYLFAGLCVVPAALCKAELGTAMPASGGSYVYLFRALGPLAGTVSGLGLWMSLLLKSAFALVGFSAYLATLAPNAPILPTAYALLVGVTVLNIAGVGKLSKFQIVVSSISVMGLILIIVFGLDDYDPTRLEPLFPEGGTGFLGAAAFVFVSYAGVTKIAALAGEVKDPGKNLPLGIMLTLFIAAVLYGIVTFALVSMVPAAELRNNLRPIFTFADTVGGRNLGMAASMLAIVTMTSMAAAGLLASSRFPFAMSRDNLLPSVLRGISERFKTPVASIVLTAAVMGLAITTLDIMKIAKLASAFTILIYVAENIAVIVLRESRVAWYKPVYKAPLYPLVQIFGVVSGIALVVALGVMPIVGAMAIAALGLVLYFAYSRGRTEHQGVVEKIGRRGDLDRPSGRALVELRDATATEARVLVALFGSERSPEMLVELGAALAEDDTVHATHLSEVDEQTALTDMLSEDTTVQSLRRRINAMAEESEADVEFQAIMSRDLVRSVHEITSRVHCQWLVMQWHGRPRRSLTTLTPIGWLINHLPTNLALFKDAGVRYVRKILVLPSPGPHDALVVRTADHLAMRWKASVTLARFVADDASEIAATAEVDYLMQLQRMCRAPTDEQVLRGKDKAKTIAHAAAGFDLLVMSAPNLTLLNLVKVSVEDQITKAATCSVLTLRTPRGVTHHAFSTRPVHSREERSRLIDFVKPELTGARLDIGKKDALLNHFASSFSAELDNVDTKTIHDALLEREREQNTGVGDGVALPHGTVTAASRSVVGVYTTKAPIEYQAIDDEKVDVFFATLCPPAERETHLQLLSDIAKLTLKTDVLEQLRAATTDEEIIAAIQECSAKLDS
jgi:APA family basic amino acid/polyamine antiporter